MHVYLEGEKIGHVDFKKETSSKGITSWSRATRGRILGADKPCAREPVPARGALYKTGFYCRKPRIKAKRCNLSTRSEQSLKGPASTTPRGEKAGGKDERINAQGEKLQGKTVVSEPAGED